jgi:trehalose synthase
VLELATVAVPQWPFARLEPVIGTPRLDRLLGRADRFRQLVAGRSIWNINSTATGGGVAEMLYALLGYAKDLGLDARWTVIRGDPDFFATTKRLHNRLHGEPGDGGDLGAAEAAHYEDVLAANAEALRGMVRPGDLVLLHDPQTAGLAAALAGAGAHVVWRCHIGSDRQNLISRSAWEFLRPYLLAAHRYVFSRQAYVPPWLPDSRTSIIRPSIDPFSAKNHALDPPTVRAILTRIGVLDHRVDAAAARFTRPDGSQGEVVHAASVVAAVVPEPADPVVVQVSRWDRLKDMAGVLRAFARHVAPAGPGYLVLAGPAVSAVSDDPEGAQVYGDCVAQWRELPAAIQRRVMLAALPVDDVDENAVMVNALQRYAAVIAQKSLAEGFGLTVAEGMWKARPVIGSAVGGIQDQIQDGTGVLLPDPDDLAAFGGAVRHLIDHPDEADRMGAAAQAQVRDNFLGDVHLIRIAEVLATLVGR